MRRSSLCLAILLALSCAAYAGQISAAEPAPEVAPALDLRFDPAVAVTPSAEPLMPQATTPPGRVSTRPFSVGLDIKNRREIGSPAARAAAAPQDKETLTDKVEGIVERSSIGLTGTYRF